MLHAEGSDDWTLKIKYVQKRDNGTYECQVSKNNLLITLSLPYIYYNIVGSNAATTDVVRVRGRPINATFILKPYIFFQRYRIAIDGIQGKWKVYILYAV